MAENTKIEWAHHTFNPWIGCTKVSPACDHCYAEADFAHRRKVVQWGAGQPRKHTAPSTWAQPLRWNAEAERLGVRYRVFCASLADVFDNEVPGQWRIELVALILATPNLDWLLLTKRIGNAAGMLETAFRAVHAGREGWADNVPPNVWIGASITSQDEADRDIPKLLAVPAAKRFLSMEPLLGPVNISRYMWPVHGWWKGPYSSYREAKAAGAECGLKRQALVSAEWAKHMVNWVIVGGESGPSARPMHPDWARSLRDQCQAAGAPFLFKQWGEWEPIDSWHPWDYRPQWGLRLDGQEVPFDQWHDDAARLKRTGKKAAGRLLDGVEHNGFPS